MLMKETFILALKGIDKQREFDEKLTDTLDAVCEGNGFFFTGGKFGIEAIVKILVLEMADTLELIERYLYEYFPDGKKKILSIDNKKYTIDTPEQLYDVLVELNKKNRG